MAAVCEKQQTAMLCQANQQLHARIQQVGGRCLKLCWCGVVYVMRRDALQKRSGRSEAAARHRSWAALAALVG